MKKKVKYQKGGTDKKPLSSFEKAFAAARKEGKKTFMWNGKSYNTKTKEESTKQKIRGSMKRMKPTKPTEEGLKRKKDQEIIRQNMLRYRRKKLGGFRDPFLEPYIENID